MDYPVVRGMSMLILILMLWTHDTLQEDTGEEVNRLKEISRELIRQLILQQYHIEEQTRSRGCSGVKEIRDANDGSRSYLSDGITANGGFMSMHNHGNTERTVGLGEMVIVLNGIEFRTRHNDYKLVKPSTTSGEYQKTEDIQYPAVPPEVTEKATVEEQITEMREWFKAFKSQNHSVRDYRNYFKPVLTYLEGAWTYTGEEVDEPYESTRHELDAEKWYDAEEENRYLSYTGFKHNSENMAYLPKVIVDIAANGTPIYAQWNYRILSHPLDFDLPLDRLRVVDDLQSRMKGQMTLERFKTSIAARFSILPDDLDPSSETGTYNTKLDALMSGVPGKNNYKGNLTEDGYWGLMTDPLTGEPMNTAFYHRRYMKKLGNNAPKKTQKHGFNDHTLFMAMTTQDKVVGMEDQRCYTAKGLSGRNKCDAALKKWTYAIPFEIIYLTPLSSWNPYTINYKGDADESEEAKYVESGERDGSKSKPFNGTHSKLYLHVPHGFLNDEAPGENEEFPKGGFYVLDGQNIPRAVTPSGIFSIYRNIPGIGSFRMRYPIAPVHAEGSTTWRELDALKDIVLKPKTYSFMYTDDAATGGDADIELETGYSVGFPTPHIHRLRISGGDMEDLKALKNVIVTTDQAAGHTHTLKLYYDENNSDCKSRILWKKCDRQNQCFDKHTKCLIVAEL